MTLDESIQEKYCQMLIKVYDMDGNSLFDGTIGDLSAQFRTIGQMEVQENPYFDSKQNSYIVKVK